MIAVAITVVATLVSPLLAEMFVPMGQADERDRLARKRMRIRATFLSALATTTALLASSLLPATDQPRRFTLVVLGVSLLLLGALFQLGRLVPEVFPDDELDGRRDRRRPPHPSTLVRRHLVIAFAATAMLPVSLYHAGLVESIDPKLSVTLERILPVQADPVIRFRSAQQGDCIDGHDWPDLESAPVTSCGRPHTYEVLYRGPSPNACPDASEFEPMPASFTIEPASAGATQWCVATFAVPVIGRLCRRSNLPCTT